MDLGEGNGSVVGYMPQELALHDELSAKETIEYYAKLYRMDKGRKYFLSWPFPFFFKTKIHF